ncbi:MAG: triple tyrosine motif-containing protein, partial [Bacteroidota bacterium]
LSRLDEATGMLTTEPSWSPRLGTVIWDLMVRKDGSLWAGTDRGLVEVDPASGQHRLRSFPTDDGIPRQITVLEEDAEGRLWLGSFRELLSLDAARTTVYPTTGGSSGTSGSGINSLVADDASLWIGLQGGIVNRLDLSTGRFSEHTPVSALGVPQTSETTYDLHLDPEGLLWVASGAGLFRYEPSARRFTQFTTAQGLPGSVVYLVQPDTQGQHWLGTNRGLARLDPAAESFTTYELSDGIGVLEFNRHARWIDPDGRVWLGGANGLLSFDPAEIRQDSSRSPVALTRISMASREGQTEIDPRAVETLTLPPGVSTVSLTFAALGFVAPDRQRYRYRLEGFDEDWVESGTQRRARYTNLPPGRYTFQVVAANADGVWNDEGFSLPVVVEPAVWQTAWFKWLVALAVLGALTAVYRARVQRLLALERLRLRIAGDLHDDLAGDLSGIALAADLLRHQVPEDAARTRLGEIRDTASGMVESLRDIVWTINPEHDTLEALVRRMRAVARQLLARHQHSLRVELPDEQRAVPMPIRHDLLLLYKEALHNVVRHAEAGQVQVVLGRENGSILLSVEDDGRGFDPLGAGSRGHGLRSMRQRAERMGGSLSVTSSPGEGTRLVVEIPMARTRDGRSTAWGLS